MTVSMPRADEGSKANERRAATIIAAGALPPAVVLGLIALIAGAVWAAVVFVAVALAVSAWMWLGADGRALAAIDGQVADRREHARLYNLVEGLCPSAGVPVPNLRVIDSASLNAVAVGRDPHHATLAVTSGLLAGLGLVELEGVIAEELVRIKQRDTLPGTVAAGAGPLPRRLARPAESEAADDLDAVALTRYPPGLAAALEAMSAAGTALAQVPAAVAGLWLADPVPGGSSGGRVPLSERVQALREL